MALPQIASASLLVGFHSFSGDSNPDLVPDYALSGYAGRLDIAVDGSFPLFADTDTRATGGSVDGSYGNMIFAANNPLSGTDGLVGGDGFARSVETWSGTSDNPSRVKLAHSYPVFRFSQSATGTTPLGYLFFDAATNTTTPAANLVVTYRTSGSATGSFSVASLPSVNNSNTLGSTGYGDYAWNLAGLNLTQNGWIEFKFDGNEYARIDNVALASFTAVPEPGSMLALGCLVGTGAFLRNRRRGAAL